MKKIIVFFVLISYHCIAQETIINNSSPSETDFFSSNVWTAILSVLSATIASLFSIWGLRHSIKKQILLKTEELNQNFNLKTDELNQNLKLKTDEISTTYNLRIKEFNLNFLNRKHQKLEESKDFIINNGHDRNLNETFENDQEAIDLLNIKVQQMFKIYVLAFAKCKHLLTDSKRENISLLLDKTTVIVTYRQMVRERLPGYNRYRPADKSILEQRDMADEVNYFTTSVLDSINAELKETIDKINALGS